MYIHNSVCMDIICMMVRVYVYSINFLVGCL